MKNRIIAITGPSGAGKTTVSELFTKRNKTFANIDVDHLKHMNPNAFTELVHEDGSKDYIYSAWDLLGKNAALLAQSFVDEGLDVIINGYLEVEAWKEIEKRIKINHKFLLLPDVKTNFQRDASRTEEISMGVKAVKKGQDYFRKTDFYSDFIKIDTTENTVEQTVVKILGII